MGRALLFKQLTETRFVTTSLTTLIDIPTADLEAIFVTVKNVGTSNLNAFEIHARAHGKGGIVTLRSTSGQYTSPSGILIETSNDLTIIPSTNTDWFILYPKGFELIRLLASRASGIDEVTVHVGGS